MLHLWVLLCGLSAGKHNESVLEGPVTEQFVYANCSDLSTTGSRDCSPSGCLSQSRHAKRALREETESQKRLS